MSSGFNSSQKCPECGWSVTLNGAAIPSHLPRGFKGRVLCPASGWMWSAGLSEQRPWRREDDHHDR